LDELLMDGPGLWMMLVAVFAPGVAASLTLLLPRQAITLRTVLTLGGFGASFGALCWRISSMGVGHTPGDIVGFPFAESIHMHMTFNPDALGLFFGLLVSGIGTLIVLYARGYFGPDRDSLYRFYPTLGFFATAMMGVVLADNMLAMLTFWELTSLSSFLLIGWDRDNPKAVKLAVQALATTGLGGLALLGGILLMGAATGEWSLSGVVGVLSSGELPVRRPGMIPWAFALMFLGGATKSAQWPFHYWLPGAMAAPTPVSAYLHSATMVKAGVYLFARLWPGLESFEFWGPTLAPIGAVTMLLGGYLALRSTELKKIFAYTTVSQLGLLTCMYGLSASGSVHGADGHGAGNALWPIMQILNHALYKAPLFIIAGAIMHIAGRKELHQLKGLFREHFHLALVCSLAAYALAGLPLTLSFTMKEAFLHQVHTATATSGWFWMIGGMTVLTAMCNVAIFVRIVTTFSMRAPALAEARLEDNPHARADNPISHDRGHDKPGEEDDHLYHHEGGFWGAWIWLPAAILVAFQFVGGVFPAWFGSFVGHVETDFGSWERLPSLWHALSHPGAPLAMSGIAITLGLLLGLSPLWRRPIEDPHNALFPAVYVGLQRVGRFVYGAVQTGNFRHYVYALLGALLVGLWVTMGGDAGLLTPMVVHDLWEARLGLILAAVGLAALIVLTALLIPLVRSRIVRVLILGTCGFAVTGMYLLYQAPDLAMTQLMFEIISVLIFLLVLRMLPEEASKRPRGGRLFRGVFGGVLGVTMGWLVLAIGGFVETAPDVDRLGTWFEANSHHGEMLTPPIMEDGIEVAPAEYARGGGGNNVVNVTLVDFRGYDTLGEITVLAIAAMGVFAILAVVPASRFKPSASQVSSTEYAARFDHSGVEYGRQISLTTPLLKTTMRLVLPLALIFAGYEFFKGHNEPGGGFIAGLVASVALAVYRMTFGPSVMKGLRPATPALCIGAGLLTALTTAATPMLFGEPFLRSATGLIARGGAEPYHWATAAFFDLGVFLVVVGVSLGIINRLLEELE
jgi:multicomponent K+:H+ antiporter subunit A